MKAIIYNSGIGKRMGELTKNNPKCMVKLYNNETVFDRQIRLLSECGINDIIITVGPFKEKIIQATKKFKNVKFTFVENELYDKTNYIYSMYKAEEYLNDDIISLHGDLVFNKGLLKKILNDSRKCLVTVNRKKELPDKDFKGRIKNGNLQEVSINIFDSDCFALQPMYKLDKLTITKWSKKVFEYVKKSIINVYAENAFNEILPDLNVKEFSYSDDYIDEVDNVNDLERVSKEIKFFDYNEQEIMYGKDNISNFFQSRKYKKVFIVTSERAFTELNLDNMFKKLNIDYILFREFKSNPNYDDIISGVDIFKKGFCDLIVSIGGGSAIDTAKGIKYTIINENYDKYYYIKHLAIPTTAGTGAESTRYAVCYKNGVKQSITSDSIIPEFVVLEPNLLETLPLYQKKSTLLDALCQSIESYWSVNSTKESKKYAKQSIELILNNIDEYLNGDNGIVFDNMLKASNLSGKAINITQTTAAHAMSYKLTQLYGISHGHAVALTIPYLWEYIFQNINKCEDNRGIKYLEQTLKELSSIFKCNTTKEAIQKMKYIFKEMNFSKTIINNEDLKILVDSVNVERLANTPVSLNSDDIKKIYLYAIMNQGTL